MAKAGVLGKPQTRLVVATFMGMVMRSNPARVAGWFAELADLEGDAREVLHLAVWISGTDEARTCLASAGASEELLGPAPDVLRRGPDEPALLDVWWAIYFATGEPQPVRKVISALEYLTDVGAAAAFRESRQTDEDRARAQRDAMFQAASWSLGSLMQAHAPLRAMCERMFDERELLTPNERIGLALVLQKIDPARWDVKLDPATGTANVTRRGAAR
jgi:hypothetical protein